MPSFLSKVFGRKKDEKDPPRTQGRVSDASLLGGQFEAVSPSATKFPEVPNGKGLGRDNHTGFTLFRAKSRQAPPELSEKRANVPQLSLRLPSQRDVFESEADEQKSLTDSVIGDRRLNSVETLTLIRACSQAITARGTSFIILRFLRAGLNSDIKASKLSALCIHTGILLLRTFSDGSFRSSFNLWLPKAPYLRSLQPILPLSPLLSLKLLLLVLPMM